MPTNFGDCGSYEQAPRLCLTRRLLRRGKLDARTAQAVYLFESCPTCLGPNGSGQLAHSLSQLRSQLCQHGWSTAAGACLPGYLSSVSRSTSDITFSTLFNMASNDVQGQCDPKFAKLKELLAANVASDEELGASICVNIEGKNVVDIWAGHIDEERKQPWEKDSIVNVWSVTKTITNLAALIAVDRGLFKVDDKVSKIWPEFAQNGKEDVEVRHFLSHASGVSA